MQLTEEGVFLLSHVSKICRERFPPPSFSFLNILFLSALSQLKWHKFLYSRIRFLIFGRGYSMWHMVRSVLRNELLAAPSSRFDKSSVLPEIFFLYFPSFFTVWNINDHLPRTKHPGSEQQQSACRAAPCCHRGTKSFAP